MKKIIWIATPLAMLVFIISRSGASKENYEVEFEKYWEDRHDFFKNSAGSPFVQKNVDYKKVEVFPFNSDYRVNAKLDHFTTREIVTLSNSDGTVTNYLKYANAGFKIDGTKQSILVLKAPGFGNRYLTAFGDKTSGETTYSGGRYLDLEIGKSDRIEIDFNKAYNPYCAYFDDFACPLPPRENLLTVAIKAGEKL
ncbi:MAG: DUF1684 domain-containing protein [Ekhidna sp.]|nr:DUF1684 domain-containing protein [Ekhidna sp.]MBC6409989.1 DUF1684 domain-containing protein [Ekhidna sp.]MBC6426921.1 DUF1684 domain-containing protein [Ekhidna sp.]